MIPRPPTNSEAEAFRGGACPLCGARNFHEGPRGGAGVNWDCLECGAVFVVGPHADDHGAPWPYLFQIVSERTNAAAAAIAGPGSGGDTGGDRGPTFPGDDEADS